MDKTALIAKLTDLKKFYDDHPEEFKEITDGVKTLFEGIKENDPELIAEGFEFAIELKKAEGMLDEDIAIKKAGASIIGATVDLLVKMLITGITGI